MYMDNALDTFRVNSSTVIPSALILPAIGMDTYPSGRMVKVLFAPKSACCTTSIMSSSPCRRRYS